MPIHYRLNPEDSFSIPPGCIGKIIERVRFMGNFTATYVYAQQQARRRLKEAMNTFVWIETLPENENLAIINVPKIAAELEVSRATVNMHLVKIREAGLIVPDLREEGKIKGIAAWRVCPFCAWRGTGKALVKYLDSLPGNHPFMSYVDPSLRQAIKDELGVIEQDLELG